MPMLPCSLLRVGEQHRLGRVVGHASDVEILDLQVAIDSPEALELGVHRALDWWLEPGSSQEVGSCSEVGPCPEVGSSREVGSCPEVGSSQEVGSCPEVG